MIIEKKTIERLMEVFPEATLSEVNADPTGNIPQQHFLAVRINAVYMYGWQLKELSTMPIEIETLYFDRGSLVLEVAPKIKNN